MNCELTEHLEQKKLRIINNLLNVARVGNVVMKFNLNTPECDSGTLQITKGEKVIISGVFYVFVEDNEVITALYSDSNVKILCKLSDDFLNILKLMLLAKY